MSSSKGKDADRSEFHTNIKLISRVRDRTDVESWREFHEFYAPLLMRYMRRLGLDESAANDVSQEVFIRLLQSLPSFEFDSKRGRFRSYLWKLTYRALVDRARREKAGRRAEEVWVRRFESGDEAESLKLDQELDEINRQQVLERAMARVRSETSQTAWICFEQRLLRDRPGAAIAADLGISDKAVFVYASRVLKAVRKQCAAIAEGLEDEPFTWSPRGT
jgi:RNA polymerase sigma-70 factor (ECF subfamily)